MDEKHLGDQFPFIGGQAMGINNNQTLRYKLWMALVKLSELTAEYRKRNCQARKGA